MIEQGTVVNVYTEAAAATAIVDHAIGVQTLQVDDAFPFGEGNGQLQTSTGVVLDYTSVDMELDTIILESPLAVAILTDAMVYVYPRGEQKIAMINLDDEEEGVRALITDPEKWPEGIRDPGEEETVNISDETGSWVIVSADQEPQKLLGSYLPPLDDFTYDAPGTSPVPVVVGGVGALYVSYEPVTDAPFVSMNIYIDDAPGSVFAPGNLVRTVDGSFAAITHMPDGTALNPAATYYVVVEAFNATDVAPPSAEVEGHLKLIDTPDISVAAAWVGTMTVDRLIGGFMNAEAVLAGDGGVIARGADGREVAMRPDGFEVIGPTSLGNPVYIDFPTDGGPNIIAGILKATTLEVSGDATSLKAATFFRKSVLEQGAEFTLGVGVLAPPDAPGVSHLWPKTNITGPPSTWRPGAYSQGDFYFMDGRFLGTLSKITPAGVVTAVMSRFPPTDPTDFKVHGLTIVGNSYFLVSTQTVSGTTRIYVEKYDMTSLALLGTWTSSYLSSSHDTSHAIIGSDNGTPMVVIKRLSDGKFVYTRINPTTMATSTSGVIQDLTSTDLAAGEELQSLASGALGSTANDFFIISNIKAYWFDTFPTIGSRSTTVHDFPVPAGASGTVWDGTTRFWTITSDSTQSRINKHALEHPNVKHWAAATKYNSVGPKETTLSDKWGWTPLQRKFIKITMSYPGATGGRLYTATGASAPADSAFELSATLADPVTAATFDALSTITGAAPPGSNNFTGGSPAIIKTTGGGVQVDGDGNGSVGTLGFRDSARSIVGNVQTGNYTPVYADAFKRIQMNSASVQTLTIPPSVFAVEQWFEVYWRGTGAPSIVPGAGVTLNGRGIGGAISTMAISARHGVIRFWQRATDIWVADGDIGAVT